MSKEMNNAQKTYEIIQYLRTEEAKKLIEEEKLYTLGKKITALVPGLVKKLNNQFDYVPWNYYWMILREIDPKHTYRVYLKDNCAEISMVFKGVETWETYGYSKTTNNPNRSESEQKIDDAQRGYAKNASKHTGLFWHLWMELG